PASSTPRRAPPTRRRSRCSRPGSSPPATSGTWSGRSGKRSRSARRRSNFGFAPDPAGGADPACAEPRPPAGQLPLAGIEGDAVFPPVEAGPRLPVGEGDHDGADEHGHAPEDDEAAGGATGGSRPAADRRGVAGAGS